VINKDLTNNIFLDLKRDLRVETKADSSLKNGWNMLPGLVSCGVREDWFLKDGTKIFDASFFSNSSRLGAFGKPQISVVYA